MHGMLHAAFRSSWTPKTGLASQVLEAQNHEIVSPSDRSNLHPLVIPLAAQQPSQGQLEPMYTCLLRQVTLSNASEQVCGVSSFILYHTGLVKMILQQVATHLCLQVMPVVQMSRGSCYLSLAARNTEEYLHRWACRNAATCAHA